MQPINDRVIIKPDTKEEITSGGIIIPDGDKELPQTGTVVAVGNKAQTLTEGDAVIFNRYAAQDFEHDGEEYKVIREGEVYCVTGEEETNWIQTIA